MALKNKNKRRDRDHGSQFMEAVGVTDFQIKVSGIIGLVISHKIEIK